MKTIHIPVQVIIRYSLPFTDQNRYKAWRKTTIFLKWLINAISLKISRFNFKATDQHKCLDRIQTILL